MKLVALFIILPVAKLCFLLSSFSFKTMHDMAKEKALHLPINDDDDMTTISLLLFDGLFVIARVATPTRVLMMAVYSTCVYHGPGDRSAWDDCARNDRDSQSDRKHC